jgi:ClpP class serine protease
LAYLDAEEIEQGMKHIMRQLEGRHWACTKTAMDAIWRIATREWTTADYEIFHRASEDEKLALVADIGEPYGESKTAFVTGDTGILLFDGPIIPRADSFSAMSGMISLDTMTADIKAFEDDQGIKRIVGLFDSPGGDVTGVSEFADLVRSLSTETIGFGYGMVASAGYWIYSAFSKRMASKTSTLGSIGVVARFRLNNDDGTVEIVSAQSPDKRPDLTSEEGRENIQTVVNELADVFVSDVARNTGVSKENVLANFGQGGELVAGSALKAGMIQKISTLDTLMSGFSSTEPAQGGGIQGGVMAKTLKEILADNPAAKAEFDALQQAQLDEPRVVNQPEAPPQAVSKVDAEDKERIEAARPYLTADYPDNIKNLAASVIAGDMPLVALQSSVAAVDAVRQEQASKQAKVETEEVGSTEAPKVAPDNDFVAIAQKLRVAQGLAPRKMGVN